MTNGPSDSLRTSILRAADLVRRGQWGQAETALAKILAAFPVEPDALQLLGLVREHQDKLAEAEQLLRRSLALRPNQPHVQVHLGRVLAGIGKYQDAIALLAGQPNDVEALTILAQVRFAVGKLAAAEDNYRAALRLAPDSQTLLMGLAVLLNQTARPAEAEPLLRKAAVNTARPHAWQAKVARTLGQSLDLQGKPQEAVNAFRHALALDATHEETHRELNALLYRLGRTDEFLASYGAAQSGPLLLQKADFLIHAERFEEARDCFARLAAMAPDSAGPQNGLAVAYAGLGRFDAAIAAYEKSLALQPQDSATKIRLAGVLLQAGEAKPALRLTDEVAAHSNLDQAALAVHELALRANQDPRAEWLADYERHVRVFDLKPPQGFSSMAEFNTALNAHLDSLHTDLREPVDQTLRFGTQTPPSLLQGRNVLLAALRQRIEEAVGSYIAGMKDDADHPLTGRRGSGFSFAGSWSSRLKDHGFHANHVHPKGWISSCYYVAVPDAASDMSARQGWIKFGEPSFKTSLRDPVRRVIQPVPGRLVLFPSYMWHGTIPFHAATARTTIAFDAIPR